jgi:glutamate transport system substrate-binding protein
MGEGQPPSGRARPRWGGVRARTARTALAALSLAAVAVALAALAGCSAGRPAAVAEPEPDPLPFAVAEDVVVEGSPTVEAAQRRGHLVIGIKEDQPGLGFIDVVSRQRSGFDVDIARWVAASLGFGEDQIEYKAIAGANREQSLVNGDVDLYVGTYSITAGRERQIDFAGPYLVTGQGLLVRQGSAIGGEGDLGPGTVVCSATGSSPIQRIKAERPDVPTTEFDVYSACVEALRNGQVDAVTTDQVILAGYAALFPDELVVVGEPFSEERYGVGLPKGDEALRAHINELLTDGGDTWQAVYDRNLGASGLVLEQPVADHVASADDGTPQGSATFLGVLTGNADLWGEAVANTLLLFFAGGAVALVLGTVVGAMRISPVPVARAVATTYVGAVRNTPLTVVFFFFAFGYPALGLPTPGYVVLAIGALGTYTATYVAEVLRSGISTVPAGQAEAARALGLPFSKVLSLVVLPQAVRSVVAPMVGVLIALLKNTTVAAGFSVAELGVIRANLSERGESALPVLLWVAVIFVVLVLALAALQRWLEVRWRVAR